MLRPNAPASLAAAINHEAEAQNIDNFPEQHVGKMLSEDGTLEDGDRLVSYLRKYFKEAQLKKVRHIPVH